MGDQRLVELYRLAPTGARGTSADLHPWIRRVNDIDTSLKGAEDMLAKLGALEHGRALHGPPVPVLTSGGM